MFELRKLYFLVFSISSFFSCYSQENYLITSNQIGNYKLGQRLELSFDKDIFYDIVIDNDSKRIQSIVVASDLYQTKEGFGVGSKMSNILASNNELRIKESKLNKSETVVGSLGNIIIVDGIVFVDSDKDDTVDLIWIDKKSNE